MFKTPWLSISIALIVRIFYWIQVSDQAWFQSPGTDPEFYLGWADAILAGHGNDYLPFPRGPLYAYILAALRTVFGSWWLIPRILNLLADIATIWLVFKSATMLSNRTTGVIASLLFALSGAAIYFTGEVLMTSLATTFSMAFLFSLIRVWRQPSYSLAVLSGLLIATASLLRPNFILMIPLALVILALALRSIRTDSAKSFKIITVQILTVAVIITPVLTANWKASGRIIPFASQGGVNFYIGNARGVSGWASELPGVGAAWSDGDAQQIASQNAGRLLTDPEVSPQFWRMGFEEIKAAPFDWLKLIAKKGMLFLNVREIGNNRPLSLPIQASWLLKILIFNSLGALFPILLIGILYNWKKPEIKILTFYFLIFGATMIMFFTNTRYRMPIVPVAVILAAMGIMTVYRQINYRSALCRILPCFAIGCVLTIPNWTGDVVDQPTQAHYIHGNAFMRQGKLSDALAQFRMAENVDPKFPELQLNIGVALLSTGDTLNAMQAFRRELDSNPNSSKAHNNLGVIYEIQGNLKYAAESYSKSLSANAFFADGKQNLARTYLKMGDNFLNNGLVDSAEAKYNQFFQLLPEDPKALHRLALSAVFREDWANARRLLEENLLQHPGYNPSRSLLSQLDSYIVR